MGGTSGSSPGPDESAAVLAIRDAVPTRRHAEMLFGMVIERLGETAWVESWNDGQSRSLFRCEAPGSSWIVPWPLLTVSRGGREGPSPIPTSVPGIFEEPPKRPGRAPRLRDLGPGRLEVKDGPFCAEVSYGADGRWFETVRSAEAGTLAGVVDALRAKTASPVEIVADFLADREPGRHGPARVLVPVPLPFGVADLWRRALFTIREDLFRRDAPISGHFAAADGWLGLARARGESREAATERWAAEVERVRPFPERPKPPPEPLPESFMEQEATENGFRMWGTLRVHRKSDTPWVEPTVANAPAGAIPVPSLPREPPPFGEWTRLVGAFGTAYVAAIRWEPEGFTLVGDRALGRLDFERLEENLAAADRRAPPELPWDPPPGFESPPPDTRIRTYRLIDERTGEPVAPSILSTSARRGFRARDLDGDRLRGAVARMRPAFRTGRP